MRSLREGSPTLNGTIRNAIRLSNVRSRSRRSSYSCHDTPGWVPASDRGSTNTSCRACATPGSGCSTTAWSQENTTTLTPIPMPSETTTTAASSGIREIVRSAWRASRTRWSKKDKRNLHVLRASCAGCNVLNVLRAAVLRARATCDVRRASRATTRRPPTTDCGPLTADYRPPNLRPRTSTSHVGTVRARSTRHGHAARATQHVQHVAP